MTANLHTTTAEALVPGTPAAIFATVADLVERLWPTMTDVVMSAPPGRLMHAVVTSNGDIDGWLTWELVAAGRESWTRVRLVHDEADTSAAPAPELDVVLSVLIERLRERSDLAIAPGDQ